MLRLLYLKHVVLTSKNKVINLRQNCIKTFSTNIHDNSNSNDHILIKWINKDGSIIETKGGLGNTLLKIAHQNDIELEGACEGVCACSTCHVILEPHIYNQLPEPQETEEDMLDQAFGLKATSRLGCQVVVTKALDGMTIKLPNATRNFYVDGHVPKPH